MRGWMFTWEATHAAFSPSRVKTFLNEARSVRKIDSSYAPWGLPNAMAISSDMKDLQSQRLGPNQKSHVVTGTASQCAGTK